MQSDAIINVIANYRVHCTAFFEQHREEGRVCVCAYVCAHICGNRRCERPRACVRACACVCVCGERERERGGEVTDSMMSPEAFSYLGNQAGPVSWQQHHARTRA